MEPIDDIVHESRPVDEELNQRGELLFRLEGRPSGSFVGAAKMNGTRIVQQHLVGGAGEDLGAAKCAEDAFAGKGVEEPSGISDERETGSHARSNV